MALNKLMKKKSTHIESFPFGLERAWIKSWCMLGVYPCLHLNLPCLWPPNTELCGPFDLPPPLSLLAKWTVPTHTLSPAAAHSCTVWQKGLLLGLGHWCPELRELLWAPQRFLQVDAGCSRIHLEQEWAVWTVPCGSIWSYQVYKMPDFQIMTKLLKTI